MVDPTGQQVDYWGDLLAATGDFSWPPAGRLVTAHGEDLMAADTCLDQTESNPKPSSALPSTKPAGPRSPTPPASTPIRPKPDGATNSSATSTPASSIPSSTISWPHPFITIGTREPQVFVRPGSRRRKRQPETSPVQQPSLHPSRPARYRPRPKKSLKHPPQPKRFSRPPLQAARHLRRRPPRDDDSQRPVTTQQPSGIRPTHQTEHRQRRLRRHRPGPRELPEHGQDPVRGV